MREDADKRTIHFDDVACVDPRCSNALREQRMFASQPSNDVRYHIPV